MIWNVLKKHLRTRYLQATIDKTKFQNLQFRHSWENLVKMYDLRMWYLQNSPHDEQALDYVQDLERLHNELNYLNSREMLFRYTIFFVLMYGYVSFITIPQMWDWQDYYEPKHEINLYNELDEGGDEGDDD